jgi:hypothetical protein
MTDAINTENVIVLFKTFEDLKREEDLILSEYEAEWAKAYSAWDMTSAAIDDDATAMAKFAGPEMTLAKAEAARLKSKCNGSVAVANSGAMVTLVKSLKAAVDKRNDRLFGYSALAKRSMRFALAHANKSYGPGASTLPPEAS